MPTIKPGYKGDGTGDLLSDFSDVLKAKLRTFYRDKNAVEAPIFGHPADAFVADILYEAWWAKAELHQHKFESNKREILAEQTDLLKSLENSEKKLRNLSPDFDRLLCVDSDPLGCADKIRELIGHVEIALPQINEMLTAPRLVEKQSHVADELSIRVLRVLKSYGIAPAATANNHYNHTSDAVQILKAIGDDIKLVRSEQTWRDIIIRAKEGAPDL